MIFCTGCGSSYYDLIKDNMSDLRINFFEGQNENFSAELSCGYREKVFTYDGFSTNKVECGVLGITFFTTYSYQSVVAILNVDGQQQEYVLEKSPFENKYMVDLEKIYTGKNAITLTLKNSTSNVELKEVSNQWKINYESALKIGSDEFAIDLEKLYFNGKLNAEGYLKIVSKPGFNQKFWYFGYTDCTGQNKGLLINVDNGKVIHNMAE